MQWDGPLDFNLSMIIGDLNIHFCFRKACSIELSDMFIVTGGDRSRRRVSKYTTNGWVEDLPDLNEERHSHGCGYYFNDEMKRVGLFR